MNIPIIDTHAHMDVRSANDYELMALTGVRTVIVPSTFSGDKRESKQAYLQYYNKLLSSEKTRAEAFGINFYIAVSVDPEDLQDINIAYEVLEELPKYFTNKHVCAVGEIGLEKFTQNEIDLFKRQLELAHHYKMPTIMHTPHEDKEHNLPIMLEILEETIQTKKLKRELLLLDDLTVDTIKYAWKYNLGAYGIAVSPKVDSVFVMHKKAQPREVMEIIKEYGSEKIVFNSALGWSCGDAMSIAKVLLYLKMRGISEEDLQKLAYINAQRFFSQNSNFCS